jgi:hypothetical protein
MEDGTQHGRSPDGQPQDGWRAGANGGGLSAQKHEEIFKRNRRVLLLTGTAALVFIVVIAVVIWALSPLFNIANVVTGGR